jgi:hypothetical protein
MQPNAGSSNAGVGISLAHEAELHLILENIPNTDNPVE